MTDSPESLQQLCVTTIAKHLNCFFDLVKHFPDNGNQELPTVFIHSNIGQLVLSSISCHSELNSDILSSFNSNLTSLGKVYIKNASSLTKKGLMVFRQHKIVELELRNLSVSINELVSCFSDWTLHNLKVLSVANSTFEKCVFVVLSKLRSLQTLNLACTNLTTSGLEVIIEDLPVLQSLNISQTGVKDISCLRKCKDRLKSLSMSNLKLNLDFRLVLWDLKVLQYLDVSDERSINPLELLTIPHNKVSDFFQKPSCLPNLLYLDVSGNDGLDLQSVRSFLAYHPKLTFLGLMMTDLCFEDSFSKPTHQDFNFNLTLTGTASEEQLCECLRRYQDRPYYMQKTLYYLYNHTQQMVEPRLDLLQLVLPVMREHSHVLSIQMAASACLYNLTSGQLGQKLHPRWLQEVVQLSLDAMTNFPSHQQLQKNTLLTLCSDRILQEVTFNRFMCAKLVMDSLVAFDDPSMNKMAVAICSILAAKISTEETSYVGADLTYMNRLLAIIRNQIELESVDTTMVKFTLSTLWNLTDESPRTCSVFLELDGLELIISVLQRFAGESSIETKVLGLVNNIAEVEHLRKDVLVDEFLVSLRLLLHSDQIDVSYFAAGIVAHLASCDIPAWRSVTVPKEELLLELSSVILNWKTPDTEMVAYRSFYPFFPLVNCLENYGVQLWAVWAIRHVCSKNPDRYCPMLKEEQGVEIIQSVLWNENIHPAVASICQEVLYIVIVQSRSSSLSS